MESKTPDLLECGKQAPEAGGRERREVSADGGNVMDR